MKIPHLQLDRNPQGVGIVTPYSAIIRARANWDKVYIH